MENDFTSYRPQQIIKGCWQYSAGHGAASITDNAVDDLIAFADAGITTFDCADIYTGAEELLGSFREAYRDARGLEAAAQIRVHTKFVPDLDQLSRMSIDYVERIIDRSLSRLKVERLDLVQFHWWNFNIPGYIETAHFLNDLRQKGKVANISVTNFDVPRLQEIVESGVHITSNQVQYSVLDSRPEHGMADFAEKNGIGLLCYGTVAGGFLSEKYVGAPEPTDDFENRSLVKYKLIIDDTGGWGAFQTVLSELDILARKHGVSIASIAARIVLDKPGVWGVILGGSRRRVDDMLATRKLSLSDEDRAELSTLSQKIKELPGDIYALERDVNGKHGRIMKYNLNK